MLNADESGAELLQDLDSELPGKILLAIDQLPQLAEALFAAHREITGAPCAARAGGGAPALLPVAPVIPSRVEQIEVSVCQEKICLSQPCFPAEGQKIFASPDQIELLCAQLRAARDALLAKRVASHGEPLSGTLSESVMPR